MFDYPFESRKIIYTTNLIENLNNRIRKYTKSKFSYPNAEAVKIGLSGQCRVKKLNFQFSFKDSYGLAFYLDPVIVQFHP
ncbi:MAG: transposase [Bacteroidales bacterium]|nr:transposase [Bacteroidales bacterium]HOS46956.1 transposase [Paludibacter sp.]HPB78239.1 transposase [Bacteroidales bacterium]HQN82563.1 transposase [Bacteroidales bacterium]